jgi:hypothetical protein
MGYSCGSVTEKAVHYKYAEKIMQRLIAPLRSEGTLHSHPSEKANILNKQFQSAFTSEANTNIPDKGSYACYGYRSVVTWVVFISFFENRRDICVVPVRWYFACFQ